IIPRPPPSSTLFPYTTLFRSHLLPDRLPSREDAHFDERKRSGAGIDHRVFLAVHKSHDAAGTNLVLFAVHDDLPLSIDEVEHLRSEEHTSELQSRFDIVCRLL